MPPKRSTRSRLKDYLARKQPNTLNSPVLIDSELMEYATLEARLASFAPPTKRSKAGWPHKSPSPQDLARVGFYYKPTASKDSCKCFMCDRQLDGWEEDDDPLHEHLKHGSDCAWALLMSIDQETAFDTSDMEDPTSEHIADARRYTFEAMGWPHEGKKGWVCKIEKMVEAGWHFAPNVECEDYASCVYCKLSLDGWEPKDNPFEEHYRRNPDCPFFFFAGTTAPSKRPKAKKGRASRSSKTSRISTQSNTTVLTQADESTGIIEIHGVDTTLEDAVEDTIASIQSTMSTTATKTKRKAPVRAKATVSKKAKTTRSKKKQEEPESQPVTQEALQERQEIAQENPKPKRSRTKKKQPTPEPELEIEPEPQPTYYEEVTIDEKPSRGKSEPKEQRRISRAESKPEPSLTEIDPANELEPEPDIVAEEQQFLHAEPQQQEEEPSYPVLPQETPDEDYQDAEEEPHVNEGDVATPQPETGPPHREITPIPVKQISPLKEATNPPRSVVPLAQVEEYQERRRSSRTSKSSHRVSKGKEAQTKQAPMSRSPSQPSDMENRPPGAFPEEVRPPLSSPGMPPPQWTPVDIETVLQQDSGEDNGLFEGALNGSLSEAEKNMTVQEWIENIASQAESKLSAEGERVVSIFEREGRRALTALESIQCV